MKNFYQMNKQGLSIIELMIVVSIIGIMASFAIPRFQLFQAKGRQSEAKENLHGMYVLQKVYFVDNDKFAVIYGVGKNYNNGNGNDATKCNTDNALRFKLTDCRKIRYNYYSQSPIAGTATGSADPVGRASSRYTNYPGMGNASNYPESSNSVFPGCEFADVWYIDFKTQVLENVGMQTYDGPLTKAIDSCY